MDYLLDLYLFSPEDIELNKKVLTWPKNMNPIFDQNDEVWIWCYFWLCYGYNSLQSFSAELLLALMFSPHRAYSLYQLYNQCLWDQVPFSYLQLPLSLSISDLSFHAPATSSFSIDSPLLSSMSPSPSLGPISQILSTRLFLHQDCLCGQLCRLSLLNKSVFVFSSLPYFSVSGSGR